MKNKSIGPIPDRAIQLIYGRGEAELKEMLENLGIYAVLSYTQNGKIVIPFVGEVAIRHSDAGLQYDFTPSQFLIRNIGQIENGEEMELENLLAKRFKHVLPESGQKKCTRTKTPKTETARENQESLF